MDALKVATFALALMASPARADPVAQWRPYIAEASGRFGIPAEWIERVMRAESAGQTTIGGRPIASRAGAMGLMQLMPATWATLRAALALGSDPYDPRDNILAGTFYLRRMYDRFGYPGLFAAYNAGPSRYVDYLGGRQSLPGETRTYLATIMDARPSAATRPGQPANPIFVALHGDPKPGAAGLFVTLGSGTNN